MSKIDQKSTKKRSCVADAFLDCFGTVLEASKEQVASEIGAILGPFFDQKSKKWHPKKHVKIDAEKVSKNNAKR